MLKTTFNSFNIELLRAWIFQKLWMLWSWHSNLRVMRFDKFDPGTFTTGKLGFLKDVLDNFLMERNFGNCLLQSTLKTAWGWSFHLSVVTVHKCNRLRELKKKKNWTDRQCEKMKKKSKELSQLGIAMPNHSTAASSSLATTPVTLSYSNLVGFGPHNSHFSNAPMDTNNAANSSNFIFRFSFDESLSRFWGRQCSNGSVTTFSQVFPKNTRLNVFLTFD